MKKKQYIIPVSEETLLLCGSVMQAVSSGVDYDPGDDMSGD